LVKEYEDVFQDPPKGLPPLRGIEHQIDFMPEVSLPNRPAYRTNPKETKRKMKKQMKYMINRVLIPSQLNHFC